MLYLVEMHWLCFFVGPKMAHKSAQLSDTECDNVTIGCAALFPILYLGLVCIIWYNSCTVNFIIFEKLSKLFH